MNRIPPHSEDSERGLLGAVIMDAENALPSAIEAGICADSFYAPSHRIVFDAIVGMEQAKRPINLITVADRLNEIGQLDVVGGRVAIESLCDSCPAPSHAGYFASRVAEKAKARAIIEASRNVIERMYSEADAVDQIASEHEVAVAGICKQRAQRKTLADAAGQLLDRWETPIESRAVAPRFAWDWLHAACGDLSDELIYIAAQPSVGKTACAVNLAVFNARRGINVLFISLESSIENISKRFISHVGSVNCLVLRSPHVADSYRARARSAVSELRGLPLVVVDNPMTDAQLAATVRRYVARGQADLIIVDNLKHIQPSKPHGSEPERFKAMSEQVKWLRDSIRKPVVMLHHLTDDGKMAWSRDIQRDADVIIHMANATEPDGDKVRRVAAKVDKNRDGMAGVGKEMRFHTDIQTFETAT